MTHITLIKFDDDIMHKLPKNYVQQHYAEKFLTWCTNSNYRNAVALEPWLEKQVSTPAESVVKYFGQALKSLPASIDEKMRCVQQVVTSNITYKTDQQRWGIPDKWSTADETLTATVTTNGVTYGPMEGDCEDGAVLMYVLARLSGIPKEQLYLWCGDVIGGGHCCLIYIPYNYPLNFAFMDWCYFPRIADFNNRPLYEISDKTVLGEELVNGLQTGQLSVLYEKMWFAFAEDRSYTSFSYAL